jgi:hypothetical protein
MSEIKVNKISPRTNCGTVQLGDSGDTITIPSGATINNQGTAVNFGATGSASWVTTVKTSTFTAVAGEGYFINTTGGVVTVNLPAGTAGAVVAIKDYAGTFDTNAVTLVQNGSDKIGGSTDNTVLGEEGIAITLVFIDSTQGWLVTDSGLQSEAPGASFVAATGGNTTLTVGDFKTHIFTGPGSLCVSAAGNSAGSNSVEYLVVAGGGGGSFGGGGGGGLRTVYPSPASGGLSVTATSYPVTVGAAGTGIPCATSGSNSIFAGSSTITSAGGGRGGGPNGNTGSGADGGSGGGGGHGPDVGGSGNTPATPVSQGEDGGTGSAAPFYGGGGGGGATTAGTNGTPGSPPENTGGNGGTGNYWPDAVLGPTAPSYGTPGPVGSTRYFAGGGGGSYRYSTSKGIGGSGGGGNAQQPSPAIASTTGTTTTGGGGGGGNGNGKAGGSGIVMIRYKFQ